MCMCVCIVDCWSQRW